MKKFQFEKSPSKKGDCPACKHKKVFRFYEGLPRKYGKCERINECNHFENPTSETKEVQAELLNVDFKPKQKEELKVVFPPKEFVSRITKDQSSKFHSFLVQTNLSNEEHLEKWLVGTYDVNTTFIIADKKQAHNIKTIQYLDDCKRDKSKFPFYLKAGKGQKYGRCLYGEHLLSDDKTICLVESEKTAVIASFFYPQYDWLATGGNGGLTDEIIHVLYGRKIYYLCDADKAGRDNATIKKLKAYKQNFSLIDLFPERNDGYDLADYLITDYPLNNSLPEIEEPEQQEQPEEPKKAKPAPNSVWEQVEEFITDRYEIHANEVSNKIEYRPKDDPEARLEELNENDVYRELQTNYIKFSLGNLRAMLGSSFVPKFNPIKDYFDKLKPYDPKIEPDYIQLLQEYLPVADEDKDFLKVQMKKMFVRSVACSLYGVVNKQAFILVHDGQNSGKSTFCRWLCPPILDNYIIENPGLDKDGLIAMSTNFIVNLDEVGKTFNKGEINQLKSILSKDIFKGRLPYAARETRLIRRANFVGSTNEAQFLNDETGSVRWLCFELTDRINFDYKKDVDINRIWAQAYYMYHAGFKFELSVTEIAENERRNKKYSVRSVEQELIQRFFFPPNVGNYRTELNFNVEQDIHFKTATDIKLILGIKAPGERTHEAKIGKALHALGFKVKSKRTEGYEYPRYGYYIVEKGS